MSRIAACAFLVAALAVSPVLAATPPQQPKDGPGGSDYVASDVAKRVIGNASAATFVYHPAGAAENLASIQAGAHRVNNRSEMDRDGNGKHGGAGALRQQQPRGPRPVHISPRNAARIVSRFSPAIDCVGDKFFGQNSVQLIWLWQE